VAVGAQGACRQAARGHVALVLLGHDDEQFHCRALGRRPGSRTTAGEAEPVRVPRSANPAADQARGSETVRHHGRGGQGLRGHEQPVGHAPAHRQPRLGARVVRCEPGYFARKLALRVASLRENKEYFLQPGYENSRRYFAAATYQPFKNTTVRMEGEYVVRRDARPSTAMARDNPSTPKRSRLAIPASPGSRRTSKPAAGCCSSTSRHRPAPISCPSRGGFAALLERAKQSQPRAPMNFNAIKDAYDLGGGFRRGGGAYSKLVSNRTAAALPPSPNFTTSRTRRNRFPSA